MLETTPVYGENLSDQKLLDWFWESLAASEQHESDSRDVWKDCYQLYASRSWRRADRDWLAKTHRVPVEINLMLPIVESVVGSDLLARSENDYQPQQPENPEHAFKADMLTYGGRVLKEKCEGHSLDARALTDLLLTGYGWGSVYLATDRVPMISRYEVPNPLEMFRDPDATEDNLRDAQFVIRRRRFRLEWAQAMFPDKAQVLADLAESDFLQGHTLPATVASFARRATGWGGVTGRGQKEVWLYEYQFCRKVPVVHFTDPLSGQDRQLPESQFKDWARETGAQSPMVFTQPKKLYYRAFIAATRRGRGSEELISNKEMAGKDSFLTHCVTGYRRVTDEGRRCLFFGLVEVGADGQRLINRTVSEVLNFLARTTKGGADIEEDALPEGMTVAQYAQMRAMTGGYALVARDTNKETRIKHHDAPKWPTGLDKMLALLQDSLDQMTVGREFRGAVIPGQTDRQGQKAAQFRETRTMIVLARTMENLRAWKEIVGKTQLKVALDDMPRSDLEPMFSHFAMEGVTHVTEVDPVTGEEFQTPLVNHPLDLLLQEDPFAWSVTVDTGPASPSAKAHAFELFMNGLLATFQEAGMPPQVLLDPLLEVSPLPASTVEKMRRGMREFQEQAQAAQSVEQMFAVLSQFSEEERYMILADLAQRLNVPLLPAGEPPPPAGPNGQPAAPQAGMQPS